MPKKGFQKPVVAPLNQNEMDQVEVVFHQFETGLREGTIKPTDLLTALKGLGLNPAEQEIIDMINEVEKKGFIYFKDFCKLALRKFREEDELEFRKTLFKLMCGTDPHPTQFRAKKYKLKERFIMKKDFEEMMQSLPVPVDDKDIEEMFAFADKDKDGKISWQEFQIMINPPPPPKPPTPHIDELTILQVKPEEHNQQVQLDEPSPPVANTAATTSTGEEATIVTTAASSEATSTVSTTTSTSTKTTTACSSDEKKREEHRKHCAICQSKVVKPIVETEISIAAGKFAKDATLINYSWRKEKATFQEKEIVPSCEVKERNEADPLFVDSINVKMKKIHHPPQQPL